MILCLFLGVLLGLIANAVVRQVPRCCATNMPMPTPLPFPPLAFGIHSLSAWSRFWFLPPIPCTGKRSNL